VVADDLMRQVRQPRWPGVADSTAMTVNGSPGDPLAADESAEAFEGLG
jgi:hypothetical protein